MADININLTQATPTFSPPSLSIAVGKSFTVNVVASQTPTLTLSNSNALSITTDPRPNGNSYQYTVTAELTGSYTLTASVAAQVSAGLLKGGGMETKTSSGTIDVSGGQTETE